MTGTDFELGRTEVNDRISIVLATFNGAKYLTELLESLAAQTRLPAELVVGDDDSTDETLEILSTFSSRSPFPVHVTARPARLGYADNFLATAASAGGSLLAFSDQDDIWAPRKLEIVAAAFAQYPDAVLVAHHAAVVDSGGRSLKRRFPANDLTGALPAGQLPLTQFPGFTMTIRSQLLNVADPERRPDQGDKRAGRMGHDAWLWMLSSCIGTSVVLSDCLVSYRQHQNLFGDMHVGLTERLRRAREAHGGTYRGQASGDLLLAQYLEVLGAEWSEQSRPEWAGPAAARAHQHRVRAAFATQRADLYSAPTRRAAIPLLARMLRSGVYFQQNRHAVVSLVKDASRAILWPPRPPDI